MKKFVIAAALLLCAASSIAAEIPSQFRGEWAANGTDGCTAPESSDILSIDAKTISGSESLFTLKDNDKTRGEIFSANYTAAYMEDAVDNVPVTLQLTRPGKLLMDGEALYNKCTDEELTYRANQMKNNQLKSDILGVWSDMSSDHLYAIHYVDEDTVTVLENGTSAFPFKIDEVNIDRGSVTIAQDANLSNAIWTLEPIVSGNEKHMTIIRSDGVRRRFSFVRDVSDADRRQLETAQNSGRTSSSNTGSNTGKGRAAAVGINTNIRVEPAGKILCTTSEAGRITVTGAQATDDGVWYKTDYCGKTGYVSSTQLKF